MTLIITQHKLSRERNKVPLKFGIKTEYINYINIKERNKHTKEHSNPVPVDV